MATEVYPYESHGFVPLLTQEQTILFSIEDVCTRLKITIEELNLEELRDPEEKVQFVPGKYYLTERGLYATILAVNNETTKPIQDWVCDEVLPSIRKYGCYPPTSMMKLQHLMEEMRASGNYTHLWDALDKVSKPTK